jgi:hypothetical protein
MLHRLDLQGHGPFVVLNVLELHIQEANLALEAFHGFYVLAARGVGSRGHFYLSLEAVFLLLREGQQISKRYRVLFPELQTDVVKQEDKNLDIGLREGAHKMPDQVVE